MPINFTVIIFVSKNICTIIYGISISVEEETSSDVGRLNLGVSRSHTHIYRHREGLF